MMHDLLRPAPTTPHDLKAGQQCSELASYSVCSCLKTSRCNPRDTSENIKFFMNYRHLHFHCAFCCGLRELVQYNRLPFFVVDYISFLLSAPRILYFSCSLSCCFRPKRNIVRISWACNPKTHKRTTFPCGYSSSYGYGRISADACRMVSKNSRAI